MSESQPLTRQGIHALFTFTPFKILRSQGRGQDSYALFLTPLSNMDINRSLNYRSTSLRNLFYVPVPGQNFNKKICHPYKIIKQSFSEQNLSSYVYQHKQLSQPNWRFPPYYMEFSYNSLDRGYHCRLGWLTLSSQSTCPISNHCPHFRSKNDGNCVHYRGPDSYVRLYNVWPRIQKRFDDPLAEFIFKPFLTIRYKESPLAVLRFTEQGSFFAFIDGVNFNPKNSYEISSTVFLREGLGFKIGNVHGIEFDFFDKTLTSFIHDILDENIEIRKWILLKKLLFWDSQASQIIRERRGFHAMGNLNRIVMMNLGGIQNQNAVQQINQTLNRIRDAQIDQELVDFATVLFLHGLAHTIKKEIEVEFGLKGEDLGYYLEHPRLAPIGTPSEKRRIVIFETAMGGYGYLRNFVNEIQKNKSAEIFETILRRSRDAFFVICERTADNDFTDLETNLSDEKQYQITDPIITAFTSSFPDSPLFPHVNSVRAGITETMHIPAEERSKLDDFIEKGPLCWDGCQNCVMLERECNFLPFDQPFLISERLLRAALEKLNEAIREPVKLSSLKQGLRKEFNSFLIAATNSIEISSPWLSPEIIQKLVDSLEKKQVKIRILTKEDPKNETQIESINLLKEITTKFKQKFEARTINELHAKGMLIDNVMLLYGSFNFTKSGLDANVENVTLDCSLKGADDFLQQFNTIWESAEPLGD